MPNDLEQYFLEIEKKVLMMKKNHQSLNEKYKETSEELELLKKKYEEGQKRNRMLEEEYKNIKLQASLSGNSEHNRLMKNYINRLVKEIDTCIAQLQNSGL